MPQRRITISEESYQALQAEAVVQRSTPKEVLEDIISKAISQEAKSFLSTLGISTIEASSLKDTKPNRLQNEENVHENDSEARKIIQVIKDFHDQGKEPLVSEVAKAVDMATRPMGVLLSKHGIRATKTHRDGKQGRFFTFEQKDKIEDLLAGGETEE